MPIYVRAINTAAGHDMQKARHAESTTHLDVLVRLLGRERTAVAEQVHEADRNATVDVEDELQDTSVVGRELTGE